MALDNFLNSLDGPATLDFEVFQGSTFFEPFEWKDENGDPINLTGADLRMKVKESYANAATLIIELNLTNLRINITDISNGKFELKIDATDTAQIPVKRTKKVSRRSKPPSTDYVYDLEIESSSGIVRKLLIGRFIVFAEVTD